MIISYVYDQILEDLSNDLVAVFVPVEGGLFRSMFSPVSWEAKERAGRDPERFAWVAMEKTREYARMKGYEV